MDAIIEFSFLCRLALVEAEQLQDLKILRNDQAQRGDWVRGTIKNIVGEAAFVDIAENKDAFLALPGRRDLKVGDSIIGEIIKAPYQDKGAKLTLSLTANHGSFVLSRGKGIAFSKNLKQSEFLAIHGKPEPIPGIRILFRSASLNQSTEDLKSQLIIQSQAFLEQINQFQSYGQTGVVRKNPQALLDFINPAPANIYTNCKELDFLQALQAKFPEAKIHPSSQYILEELGIESQIAALSHSELALPSGGRIFIEETRAFTAVDVDTNQALTREIHPMVINREALRELIKQIRLRNLSGLLVVDFLKLKEPALRHSLWQEAQRQLKSLWRQGQAFPLTDLGLMQITLARESSPISESLFQPRLTQWSQDYIIHRIAARLGKFPTTKSLEVQLPQHSLTQTQSETIRRAFPERQLTIKPVGETGAFTVKPLI